MNNFNRGLSVFNPDHLPDKYKDLPIEIQEMILDVADMRYTQRGFFKHYGSDWKAKRQRWESRVDKLISIIIPESQNIELP